MSTVKRECRVVMLPTEKASDIILRMKDDIMHHRRYYGRAWEDMGDVYQHLYILSDDEIKDGDWIYHPLDVKPIHFYQTVDLIDPSSYGYKKIIATTDSSIGYTDHRISPVPNFCDYPQPSPAFIQKYIDAYNSGKPIEKIMVEYETNNSRNQQLMFHEEHKEYFFEDFVDGKIKTIYLKEEVRINTKDNTITISKVKDSWTREEMVDFAWKTLVQGRKASTSMKDLFNELPEWFDKWVEENL